jgi:GT2 family glycosyltransferase
MSAAAAAVSVSVVILTYNRDAVLAETLAVLRRMAGDRQDIEVILVDNNPDAVDRLPLLADFPHARVVRMGGNKGCSARNDGMAVARGELIVLLDDDVVIATPGFIERFEAVFAAEPEVGVVNVRKLDGATGTMLSAAIPHSRKTIDTSRPFFTFRFIGGLVGFRAAVWRQVGGFDRDLFYGEEEREYSYRIIKAGWKIYYEPSIEAVETNAVGGRRSRASLYTDLLVNRYIIAWLHRPALVVIYDAFVFTAHLLWLERRLNVMQAVARFVRWLGRPDRARRDPIGPQVRAYIRACGGTLWR